MSSEFTAADLQTIFKSYSTFTRATASWKHSSSANTLENQTGTRIIVNCPD